MKVACTTPGCPGTITLDNLGNGGCSSCGTKITAPRPASAEATKTAVPKTSTGTSASATGKKFPQGTPFGKYSIDRFIGGGAMGDVYLVYDKKLGRRAALKVPKFSADDNSELLKRFDREAKNAAKVRHPNICAVFDSGQEGDYPYVVMEFVDGEPLNKVVKDSGPMEPREAAGLLMKLANAMTEAHAEGIIHRDLKTANVMINRRGEPMVMDFGLARAESDEGLTASGTTLGTTHYMSPEQLLADASRMGPRADIYSLGVVLFELLTGRRPYEGSVFAVTKEVLSKSPEPSPSEFRDELPNAMDVICKKAIAKDLMKRYASMKELAADLDHFLKGETIADVTAIINANTPTIDLKSTTKDKPPVAWGNRLLIGALVAALIGLVAYIAFGR